LCEVGAGDSRALKRWIYAILPEMEKFILNATPNPKNIEIIQEKIQEPPSIDKLIFRKKD